MRNRAARQIKEVVEQKTGAIVELQDVTKNNGGLLTGMSIREQGAEHAVVVHIDGWLANILTKQISVEYVADEVIRQYEKGKERPVLAGFNPDREYILQRAELKLINQTMNRELLERVPHRIFLDLAVVYSVNVSRGKEESCSFTVDNRMLEAYGISQEELDEAATNNTKSNGFGVKNIMDVLGELVGEETDTVVDIEEVDETMQMFVMTNKYMTNGATAMLFPELFEKLAEKVESDLFIIPSSIHEVLAIPAPEDIEDGFRDVMREMIRTVNTEQVRFGEILSYSLYEYNRKAKMLSIAR